MFLQNAYPKGNQWVKGHEYLAAFESLRETTFKKWRHVVRISVPRQILAVPIYPVLFRGTRQYLTESQRPQVFPLLQSPAVCQLGLLRVQPQSAQELMWVATCGAEDIGERLFSLIPSDSSVAYL